MFFKQILVVAMAAILVSGEPPSTNIDPDNAQQHLREDEGSQDPVGDGQDSLLPSQVNSIFPNPNGPFYGFPFDLGTTFGRMLPFTVSGYCEAGKIYSIKRPEDILNYQAELECLYNTGVSPAKIPEGALYGTVLSAINTRLFNQLVGQLWKGKSINRTQCNGNTAYVGWNNVRGNPVAPFVAYLVHPQLNLAPGEYDNGRSALVFEYGIDIPQACPEYRAQLLQNHGRAILRGASLSASTFLPTTHMVEVFRFLGKQDDGGDIYLGKTLMKDAYREDQQAATIAYSVLINYDKDANPLSVAGLPTLPSAHGFKYMHPGIVDFVFRLNPIDNLLTSPFRTINKLVRGAIKTGTNSLLFAQSLPFSFQNLRRNSQFFRHRFYHDVNAKRQMSKIPTTPVQTPSNKGRTDIQLPVPSIAQPPATVEVTRTPVPPSTTKTPVTVRP